MPKSVTSLPDPSLRYCACAANPAPSKECRRDSQSLAAQSSIFLMETMFSIFQQAIQFDCLFLAIFKIFTIICEFIFDKFAPLNKCFKDALNPFRVHSSAKF